MRLTPIACALLWMLAACDDDGGGANPDVDSGMAGDGDSDGDAGSGGDGDGGMPGEDAGPLLPPPEPTDPWDNVATTISADALEFAGALCDRFLACGYQVVAADRESCITFTLGLQLGCDKRLEAVSLPDLAGCKTAIEALDCAAIQADFELPDACDTTLSALSGSAGENQPCGSEAFCAPGLSCTTDYESCGMCVKSAVAGEDCIDDECATGARCNLDGKCEALLADAADCTDGSQCLSSYCTPDKKCGQPKRNDPCEPGDVCGNAFMCVNGKCGDGGAVGADCTEQAPCAGFLVCHEGKCTQPTQCGKGKLGEPCVFLTYCAQDLLCDIETSTCTDYLQLDEECGGFFGLPCATGLTCTFGASDEDPPTCQPETDTPGASCQVDEDCISLRCVSGKCSASDLGEDCFDDAHCASGACDFASCVTEHGC